MKKIEDYLKHYIGCDVMVTLNSDIAPKKAKLIGSYIDQWQNGQYHPTVQVDFGRPTQRLYYLLSQVKLLLRPLSSMTEEEERHMISTQDDVKLDGYPEILLKADSGETFRWMLSKGFDLFYLIDANLALDATKIEKVKIHGTEDPCVVCGCHIDTHRKDDLTCPERFSHDGNVVEWSHTKFVVR